MPAPSGVEGEKETAGFSKHWKLSPSPFPSFGKYAENISNLWKKRAALLHALNDGEDFELLFTVPRRKAAALEKAWRKNFRTRLTAIGTITAKAGQLVWRDAEKKLNLKAAGYEHFR